MFAGIIAVTAIWVGGCTADTEQTKSLQGTFGSTVNLVANRSGHTATVLRDGTVLIAGGDCDGSVAATAEIFDPADGTFSPTGDMVECRAAHTATLLPSGVVLIVGGMNDTRLADMRLFPATARYSDYRVHATTEIYDPETGEFSMAAPRSISRYGHTATLLPSGIVLIAGGTSYLTAELYDPDADSFQFAGEMGRPREHHTATLLGDGRVLLIGGSGGASRSAETFDPPTRSFTPAADMITPRYYHTATLLSDGKVLVTGGLEAFTPELASAEIYDPSSGVFMATGRMIAPRDGHAAALLPDGRVLVTGGRDIFGRYASTVVFSVSKPVDTAGKGLDARTLSPISDGGVLAAVEVYDPVIGEFTAVSRMMSNRDSHTTSVLRDGKVLVAGGIGGFSSSHRVKISGSAEIFSPLTRESR